MSAVDPTTAGPQTTPPPTPTILTVDGTPVAEYHDGARLPAAHSPRPSLHPVRTLGGRLMTASSPADHLHHYGVSVAVPDVDGTSYWGGRTWVRDEGSTLLDNHGAQRRRSLSGTGGDLREELVWQNGRGDQLAESRRLVAWALPGAAGWVLDWSTTLAAEHGAVTLGSPATNGRPGAGYGGIFWRLATRDTTRVLSPGGVGEARAHQSDSAWLALNQESGDERVGLLLSQPDTEQLPWFVRATEYAGAGPMLAASGRLRLESGTRFTTRLRAVILDRWVEDTTDAERLLADAGRGAPGGAVV